MQDSSRGQRRGFYWQDWYAAWIMLRCWAEPADAISAVEVEAVGAPHVDDVVIHQAHRTLFKQLKHKVTGTFTGADLFSPTKRGPSLIRRLFQGWETLRNTAGSGIEVYLTTNAMPSEASTNQLISPVRLQRDLLVPARLATWACPDELKPICDELLRLTCAADLQTLRDFLAALRLEFREPNEEDLRRQVTSLLRDHLRPATTAETEADAWVARVYDLSTRYPSTGPLSRSDIDREVRTLFGAVPRRAEHRLALPDHHVPRPEVAAKVLQAALQLGTGYLLVFGPPGCGKTTLATWIANEHDSHLMMRYHVFDPTLASGLERRGRASALEFVRTMFDVLCDRFPSKALPYAPEEVTLHAAVSALRQELERLAEHQPRLVLVDGIDHIVRAKVVRGSLFDALPQPPPTNVVFVLFGQPDWEYPAWLLRMPRVTIPALTEIETRSVVCSRMGWRLDCTGAAAVAASLHHRSRGNPLSLFYNLAVAERLGDAPEDVNASFQNATFFGDDPHEEYGYLFDDLNEILQAPHSSRSLQRELLAFFAVAGAAVTADRLSTGFVDDGMTHRQARDFLEGLRPVVLERQPGRFWLFHDDFRRYAEQRTDESDLRAAHRRVARVLEHDWRDEELEAWVEHLWNGSDHHRLASLVRERTLEEWFAIAPPRSVLTLHRLSFAAALMLGDEVGILENALAAARAAEAMASPTMESGGRFSPRSGLRKWTFLVPPSGTDSGALNRRTDALQAAASGCRHEPTLAAEIATRFCLPLEMIPDTHEHESHNYVLALERWLLRSGDLRGARELAASERFAVVAAEAISAEIAAEMDADVVAVWATTFAGISDSLDRACITAAALHLAEGRDQNALSIARAFACCPSAAAETERDTAVLLSLLAGKNFTEPRHLEARVRIRANAYEAHEWRDFFFDGFTTAAAGPLRELALYDFTTRFDRFIREGRHASSAQQLARFLWRCGCAAGLACRGPDLLTPQELAALLLTFIGDTGLKIAPLEALLYLEAVPLYLPWIMLVVRRREALSAKAIELLLPAARRHLSRPGPRTYGLLEAVWLLDQAAWRSMAADALALAELPGSDADDRVRWFDYWKARASARRLDIPQEFLARATVAALGVPRKTDPVALAMELLSTESDTDLDTAATVRRLVDLLIRLDAEPEGGRAANRHLPQLLAFAIQVSPSLFWTEFLRSTVEHRVAEPFGDTPGRLALAWLRADEAITVDECLAIWYWVAACPGCFGRESLAAEVGRIVSERLTKAGAHREAASVGRWCVALAAQDSQDEASPQNGLHGGDGKVRGGALPEQLLGTVTAEQEPLFDHSLTTSSPAIADLEPRWFSHWWSPEENRVLREFLAKGGDEAWTWACERLGSRIATNTENSAFEAEVVASGLIRLRTCRPPARAVEIAVRHLAQKVRFQEAPGPRASESGIRSRVQALVALIARGADVGDVETLRRSLRSLGALARRPSTASAVEQEMLLRLETDEARAVTHALLVLREVHTLAPAALVKVRALTTHPDAWCRWLACRILNIEAAWPTPRPLVTAAGPIAFEPLPTRTDLGDKYFNDISSIREIYVRKLGALLDMSEDELRSHLEIEFRGLPIRPQRLSGWHHRLPGAGLTSHGMGEAAGRLACRLCSVVPAAARPAVLSAVARQDPWLLMAEPAVAPPHDWIELCRFERRTTPEREESILRSLAIMPQDKLTAGASPSNLAAYAMSLLEPDAPAEYTWVAEPWPTIAPPRMPEGEVIPLAFYNRPFTELHRDRFMLVPRWDLLPFAELRFVVEDTPAWVHPKLGPVIVGAYGERLAKPGGAEHPVTDWWTGWYASPLWLKLFERPRTLLAHCWHLHWLAMRSENKDDDGTVEFGLEHDLIRWR